MGYNSRIFSIIFNFKKSELKGPGAGGTRDEILWKNCPLKVVFPKKRVFVVVKKI